MILVDVTINVDRQDLIDLGVSGEGQNVKRFVNANNVTIFYPSYDAGKGHMGCKIHLTSGENIWCYETYEAIKEKLRPLTEYV